jgi:hypothetical protein
VRNAFAGRDEREQLHARIRVFRRAALQVRKTGDGDSCLARKSLLRPPALVAKATDQHAEADFRLHEEGRGVREFFPPTLP